MALSVRAATDALTQDIRFGLRSLRARPGFTAMVAVTFAIGIGANVTMFGLLDRLLFRAPPHVRDPERLVQIHARWLGSTVLQTSHSYGVYKDMRDGVPDFESVATATPNYGRRQFFPLGRGSSATQVGGALVSASYFSTLGATPVLGRFFVPDDDYEQSAQKAAVIGYGLWQRRFLRRPDVLGQTLDIGSDRYTIVGVAAEGFAGFELSEIDVWLPIAAASGLRFDRTPNWSNDRGAQWLTVIARLKPGVRAEQALAQATAAYRAGEAIRIAQATRTDRLSADSEVVVFGSVIPGRSSAGFGLSATSTEVRVAKLLGGVSLIVLLIACANIANLLLVRSLGRRREIAVRLALGAGRRRLLQQIMVEGMLLALLGGTAALVVAYWGSQFVRSLLLGDTAWAGSVIDGRVIAFTAVVALLTGVATALLPAIQTSHPDLTSALKAGARSGVSQQSRTHAVLLASQSALAVVLLAGAGLFMQSLRNVASLPLGVDVDHVVVGQIEHGSVGLTNVEARQLYDRFVERVRVTPGVRASAVSVGLPFALSWGTRVSIPGRALPPMRQRPVQYAITPDYFDALGVRLLSGRVFDSGDQAGATLVTIVNESFARIYFPRGSPIGSCIKLGADTMPCTAIVGVVSNTRRQELVEGLIAQVYRPLDQLPSLATNSTISFFGYTLIARTQGDAAQYVEPVRRAMLAASPLTPYPNVRTMREVLGRHTRSWNLGAEMFGGFGVLALILAIVGLYAVVAFSVAQRVHELGVRVALGAQSSDVVRLTIQRGIAPALAGIVIGIVLALLGGKLVAALLFDVSPRDPQVLAGVSAVLLIAATLACVIPGLKAARVDPIVVLRAE